MRTFPNTAEIEQLPCYFRTVVPEAYLDAMGHMNIRYYLALFDDAAWELFADIGMHTDYYKAYTAGAFALEHHIHYLAEVHQGDRIAVYSRMLARTAKRIHFMHFMLNETQQKLAATLEAVGSHADLTVRRTSPFPAHIAANIDAMLANHVQVSWEAPVCGVIRA